MGSIKAKLIATLSIFIAGLVLLWCVYQQSNTRLIEARHWVEHTHIVLEKSAEVFSLIKDLETGERGYMLTGEESFLDPYNQALAKLPVCIGELKNLTRDNLHQQRRIERLEQLYAAKLAISKKIIEQRRLAGHAVAVDLSLNLASKKIMDQCRTLVDDMGAEERQLLQSRVEAADSLNSGISNIMAVLAILVCVVCATAKLGVLNHFTRSISLLQTALDKVSSGDLDARITSPRKDEFYSLASSYNKMAEALKSAYNQSQNQSWLTNNRVKFGQMLQGETDVKHAAQNILGEYAQKLGSSHGLFYIVAGPNDKKQLQLLAAYAHDKSEELADHVEIGQGLIGQCARDLKRIEVNELPENYIRIKSGTGDAVPTALVIVPVTFDGKIKAVIEQARFGDFTAVQLDYLEQTAATLGIVISSIEANQKTEQMLRQEQAMTEELQSQQEILTENNRNLESLTRSLQSSEEELRQQQEELHQINEELEERSRALGRKNDELEVKNIELEEMRLKMQDKAEQLSLTSKYKSEFLSNMSHELRTPLNSLLILSQVLTENTEGNLTAKQVDFARTINAAGKDLLVLIDDVLDLSKIEAGVMSIVFEPVPLLQTCESVMENFRRLADEKQLELGLSLSPDVPAQLKTDGRRLQQILKNLLANAIKFTESGSVNLKVSPVAAGWRKGRPSLDDADMVVAFTVSDTGIGIAPEKQNVIFEAFQQADGTVSRKFGGTGLGLAISKEIAALLGGQIELRSEPGLGSIFTLYLPSVMTGTPEARPPQPTAAAAAVPADGDGASGSAAHATAITDDRNIIAADDHILLMLLQDGDLSSQMMDMARARGFKVIAAGEGKSAFALVRKYKPDGIAIEINNSDRDSWSFLDRLKREASTRHIPVHVICDDNHCHQAQRLGAVGHMQKPASRQSLSDMMQIFSRFADRQPRELLIVEDNHKEMESLKALLEGEDVRITSASSGDEAIKALSSRHFDCMVLDLGLPDMTGFDLLQKLQHLPDAVPVVVHTARELTAREETELRRSTDAIIVKGARSPERLLDETSLFLHRVEANLPQQKRQMLERLHLQDRHLMGRKVLIVDDDVRHIFAITSLLEQYGMDVHYAENGREALAFLEKSADVEIILMDVMMPEMDGLEAMREIRKQDHLKNLPIIALTAKAVKGDREGCLAAGASDYLSKPVDSAQLLSLMRVWLYQSADLQ